MGLGLGGAITGVKIGGILGVIYSLATRFSDLKGPDQQKLVTNTAQFTKQYNLNPNNNADKAQIINFVEKETSRIKNWRMGRRFGKGLAYGAGIGAASGAATGAVVGGGLGHSISKMVDKGI